MPMMEKSKLHAFAVKAAKPPNGAVMLAQKRNASKAPPPMAGKPAAPAAAAPGDEMEEESVNLFDLVEEAAQKAESGEDVDLEDVVAETQSAGPDDVPEWVEDPAKWAEAAEAVGLGVPGTEDKYDEPIVVTAYLYKMIGGPVKGLELPDVPVKPEDEEGESDMSKPGAAAKAIQARAASKGAPPAAGAASKAPPAGAKAPPAAPGKAPPAATGKAPGPAAGAEGGDELKQMLDEAAEQAASTPDPEVVEKLQLEPPQEGTPPSWAVDQDKWAKAEEAVKMHWDEYPEPFMVVAHVYKNMGGAIQ